MKTNGQKIDFVVLWVDPNDKEWQKQRDAYSGVVGESKSIDNNDERYRDWDLFKYWFRGVEKYAPWVNKVHLVTCGHVPKWLNKNHPKINIVKHSDFMPKNVLPTFNTNAIELCLHRIKGLSECFVLFNDDVFITKPVKPSDFFKGNIPVNTMSLLAITPSGERKYCRTLVNNIEILNDHFDFNTIKRRDIARFLSIKQGKYLLTTLPLLAYNDFPGFKNYHIANSYRKSIIKEVWLKEPDILNKTISTRFRDYDTNVSDWLFNYWQFAKGLYRQRWSNFGINICMDNKKTASIIRRQKKHIVCLSEPSNNDFQKIQKEIDDAFESILSRPCMYENGYKDVNGKLHKEGIHERKDQ